MMLESSGTGLVALDDLLGGLIPGDNVVWVCERAAAYELAEAAFLRQATAEGRRCTYVVAGSLAPGRDLGDGVEVISCAQQQWSTSRVVAQELERRAKDQAPHSFVVDGLEAFCRVWGRQNALAFFSRMCPMMLEQGSLAYWRASRSCGEAFLDAVRQVTQCVLELRGQRMHVIKAEGRPASTQGLIVNVEVADDELRLGRPSVAGRLALGLSRLRQDRHLTQEQLAELAGVTASAISQAESATRGLSLETLTRLAEELSISLDELVRTPRDPGYVLVRHDRRRATRPGVVPLFDDPYAGLRAFLILVGPQASGQPHVTHKGTELLVVHRGLLQVSVGADTPVLRAGDAVLATRAGFTAWTNLRSEPAILLWVLA